MAVVENIGRTEFLMVHDPIGKKTSADFYSSNPRYSPSVNLRAHALHYGTAGFEGIRFYNTEKGVSIFKLDEHVDRLFRSMVALNLKLPITKKGVRELIIETVRRSGISEGYIRPLVGKGEGPLGVGAGKNREFFYVMTTPWGKYVEAKKDRQGAMVMLTRFVRKSALADFKLAGGYISGNKGNKEAIEHGADEALHLNSHGSVSEGSGENIFIQKGNSLVTSRLGRDEILGGITRGTIMEVAKGEQHGFKVREGKISLYDLLTAKQVFFTGTAAEITPISHIQLEFQNGRLTPRDGKQYVLKIEEEAKIQAHLRKLKIAVPKNGVVVVPINKGSISPQIRKLEGHFQDIVRQKDPKFHDAGTIVETVEKEGTPLHFLRELKEGGGFDFQKTGGITHPYSQFGGKWSLTAKSHREFLMDLKSQLPKAWLKLMKSQGQARRRAIGFALKSSRGVVE